MIPEQLPRHFQQQVSPDALQEFKIQTSTFAPEFGRSRGRRSDWLPGRNEPHSGCCLSIFETQTDANDWFANNRATGHHCASIIWRHARKPSRIPHLYDGLTAPSFLSVEDLVMLQP